MMTLLFILLLAVTFMVLLYLLRPTTTETAVQQQLEHIEESRSVEGDGSTILRRQALSASPWLDQIIRDIPGSLRLAQMIRQAGLKWQVSSVMLGSAGLGIVVAWIASLSIPSSVLSVILGAIAASLPLLYLYVVREVRFRKCDALLPDAVDLMARGLRAGHAVPAVLEMVGQEIGEPLAGEFRILHEEQNLGLPLRDAMLNLVDRVPRDDMRFLATAILLQKETGGNLAAILDKTAFLARERARLYGQLRIYTAQGRITGWILCIAPFIMFGLMSMVNWKYERVLFTNPAGLKVVYMGLGMMLLGILVIRKIIDIKV
jgi:tight adherence protein B